MASGLDLLCCYLYLYFTMFLYLYLYFFCICICVITGPSCPTHYWVSSRDGERPWSLFLLFVAANTLVCRSVMNVTSVKEHFQTLLLWRSTKCALSITCCQHISRQRNVHFAAFTVQCTLSAVRSTLLFVTNTSVCISVLAAMHTVQCAIISLKSALH